MRHNGFNFLGETREIELERHNEKNREKKGQKGIRRRERKFESSLHGDLFTSVVARHQGRIRKEKQVEFLDPDPEQIMIGSMWLRDYLKDMGSDWVIKMRKVLRELDWSEFKKRYKLTGRSPYAPEVMMGLILYGTMNGAVL